MSGNAPRTVRAGDGREIIFSESQGPVYLDGTHASLADVPQAAPDPAPEPAAGPKDNPPAPRPGRKPSK